jgi:ABC-type uncharacterized transport system involved in gliding motility auxiliary subunit
MNKKTIEAYLSSVTGVVAVLLILVAINYASGFLRKRIDLTADRAHTLSKGTKRILSRLDGPVQVRLYASRDERAMPVFLKNYAQRVEDLLGEYRQASKGNVEILRMDPEPDSDAEDSARLDGIEPQMTESGDSLYFGLSITMLDQKQTVPFLDPRRERLLEYDLSRAISRVITPERPVVGVMSPLPVAGRFDPMMMQMGGRPAPAWAFHSELKKDFTLKEVEMTAKEIPQEVTVLVLIHPRGIAPEAEYALDQFVLRGGKLIAFLDPNSALDRQGPMGGMSPASNSTLAKLLPAWGVAFETEKVVADLDYVSENRQGRTPAVLSLNANAMNKEDVVTGDVDNAMMAYAGAFSGTPPEGITMTPLIQTSERSQMIDSMSAQMDPERLISRFEPSGKQMALAVRLAGKFKTAFPEGAPGAKPGDEPGSKEGDKDAEKPKDAGLKESAGESAVILFGDADMIQDPLCVAELQNPFGGRMVVPANGNLGLAQAAVEQLAGDSDLIAVRGRAVSGHPFTVVKAMQAKAEESYRGKIRQLEESLSETERNLSELQTGKKAGQQFILSSEQQQEIANFRKKEGEVRKELKSVRRNLRSEIDALETRLKWANVALIPALVLIAGTGIAVLKRRRVAAKRS